VTANAHGILVIERILRDRQGIWQQVVEDRDLSRLTGQMMISSAAALAIYGAVLGSFHSVLMALTSAVKLPLLFLVTLAICLPTLYLFNLVFGARLSVRQSLSLVMVAITVTAMLALAFAPISLFFLITAPDYGFFKLLNVAILGLSALVGLRFLTTGMQVLNAHGLLAPAVAAAPAVTAAPINMGATDGVLEPVGAATGGTNGAVAAAQTAPVQTVPVQAVPAQAAAQGAPGPHAPGQLAAPAPFFVHPPGQPVRKDGARLPQGRPEAAPRPPGMTLLYVWILLFGFVGTQLAWTLRPFFGSPGEPFGLYREIAGNFYAEIFRTLFNLF
jgi:hypothetical protein